MSDKNRLAGIAKLATERLSEAHITSENSVALDALGYGFDDAIRAEITSVIEEQDESLTNEDFEAVKDVVKAVLKAKETIFDEHIKKLAMKARRAPSPRNPALCVGGIPLPGVLATGIGEDGEAILVHSEYARIADLQFSLKSGKKVHPEDIPVLREALQEALRRSNNDPEVQISKIIDQAWKAGS